LKEPFFIAEWGCASKNERGKLIQEALDELECTTICLKGM
jgi:hypothetical protein